MGRLKKKYGEKVSNKYESEKYNVGDIQIVKINDTLNLCNLICQDKNKNIIYSVLEKSFREINDFCIKNNCEIHFMKSNHPKLNWELILKLLIKFFMNNIVMYFHFSFFSYSLEDKYKNDSVKKNSFTNKSIISNIKDYSEKLNEKKSKNQIEIKDNSNQQTQFEKIKITIDCNFNNFEKNQISNQLNTLNIPIQENLTLIGENRTTHYILKNTKSDDFEMIQKFGGVLLITRNWLNDCIFENKILDEKNYSIHVPFDYDASNIFSNIRIKILKVYKKEDLIRYFCFFGGLVDDVHYTHVLCDDREIMYGEYKKIVRSNWIWDSVNHNILLSEFNYLYLN
jgi:hypothetical protein